jgi:Ni/Co efflux regulator RcnB
MKKLLTLLTALTFASASMLADAAPATRHHSTVKTGHTAKATTLKKKSTKKTVMQKHVVKKQVIKKKTVKKPVRHGHKTTRSNQVKVTH